MVALTWSHTSTMLLQEELVVPLVRIVLDWLFKEAPAGGGLYLLTLARPKGLLRACKVAVVVFMATTLQYRPVLLSLRMTVALGSMGCGGFVGLTGT